MMCSVDVFCGVFCDVFCDVFRDVGCVGECRGDGHLINKSGDIDKLLTTT